MHPGPLFANWPFRGLEPEGYDQIACDPPWDFSLFSEKGGNKSAQKHYKCLPIETIKQFPIADLAKKDCMILLWGTSPMIIDQLGCLKYWGFTYKTMGIWRKMTRHGKVAFSTGYLLRGAHEVVLVATRGKPQNISRSVRSVFDGATRGHSRKPTEFYTWAERLMPKAERRVELFSRTNRPGWDHWGDEVGKWTEGAEDAKPATQL